MADDELTPAQAEAVRRLLADARHDEGLPDDVTARLDERLGELVAERGEVAAGKSGVAAEREQPAAVLPLRRPGRLPKLLMAAAAVVVVGYGTVTVVSGSGSGEDSSGAGEVSSLAEDQGAGEERDADDGGTAADSGDPPAPTGQAPQGEYPTVPQEELDRLPIVRPAQLRADLRRISAAATEGRGQVSSAPACGPVHRADGERRLFASYEGRLAMVLAYPPTEGVQLVELFVCEGPQPRNAVASVTFEGQE